ncbi:RluA family pseudouridine synthase [Salibacterium aidingense]|uniref:RluA family pseudouridine synthase n=1 Tax=Salibacterium aidingense TaxID=384933 RepID=UPI0003F8FDDD|nr:RluA family pseudouridine synthase [Salibacterium aidingense]
MEKFHKLKWTISANEHGKKVKTVLRQCKGMSAGTWKTVNKDGCVTRNGVNSSGQDMVEDGDILQIYLPKTSFPPAIEAVDLPLDILFEDDHLLIINKDPFLPTLPGRGREIETLAGAVRSYYEKKNIRASFHAVSRLDRQTSGIVTIAKHRFAHQRLAALFDRYAGLKKYVGVADGRWFPSEGLIDAPIERRPDSIVKQHVTAQGKRAKTGFYVSSRLSNTSVVHYTLYSGRTHQIRVHSAYIGHPLAGDDLYGESSSAIPRQALHAHQLRFCHPVTEEWKTVEADLPQDMRQIMP